MKAMSLNDLSNLDVNCVDEDQLLRWNYICDKDMQEEAHAYKLLERIYKKKSINGEPSIVIVVMGMIIHKIWIESGKISRSNGQPADVCYDEHGISGMNWYLHGQCINDYISFVCLRDKKPKSHVNKEDIDFIKEYFYIK